MFFQMGWNHQPVDLWNAMERQNTSDQPRNQRSKKEHMGETDQRAINEARNDWVGFKSIVISWSASFQLSVLGSDFQQEMEIHSLKEPCEQPT